MELRGEDGSVLELSESAAKELGRGPGLAARDRTVSRRQMRLQLQRIADTFRVSIDVIGPNPVCVVRCNGERGGATSEVEIAKAGTQSVLKIGDKFSLSIQEPVFYTLQEVVARAGRGGDHRFGVSETRRRNGTLAGDDQSDEGGRNREDLGAAEDPDEEEGIAEAVMRWQRRKQERLQVEQERPTQDGERKQAEDIISEPEVMFSEHDAAENAGDLEPIDKPRTHEANADLIKRFGFVVEGFEFERYGRKGHDTSKWDWQIGKRPENDGDEDEDEEGGGHASHYQTGKRSRVTAGSKVNQKAKRANDDDDDDDWRGDSEGERELLSTGNRPMSWKKDVQTRSHDLATSSETMSEANKRRKLVSTSENDVPDIKSKGLERGKTRANSRPPTASTSNKKSTKRKPRAKEEDEEEDDDDEGDLDGFLVDDVEEEDESEFADDEDEWTDEEEDEIDDERGNRNARLAGHAPAPSRPAKDTEPDRDDAKPMCKYGNKCFRKNKDHLAEFRH